jgi:hypothetical protein
MTGLTPGIPVRWTLLTRAHVETAGRQALLTQNGRSLRLHVEQPARIELLDRPADPPADDFNAPNPGTRLIAVETQAPADGRLRIEIRFVPERGQSAATPTEPR